MGMTIDEAIKYAEEAAEEQEKAAKEWHENQVRKCKVIPFAEMDYTHENECKKCAKECRQIGEWLKKLKAVKQIIVQHDSDRMPEDYWYIDKIREVVREVEE